MSKESEICTVLLSAIKKLLIRVLTYCQLPSLTIWTKPEIRTCEKRTSAAMRRVSTSWSRQFRGSAAAGPESRRWFTPTPHLMSSSNPCNVSARSAGRLSLTSDPVPSLTHRQHRHPHQRQRKGRVDRRQRPPPTPTSPQQLQSLQRHATSASSRRHPRMLPRRPKPQWTSTGPLLMRKKWSSRYQRLRKEIGAGRRSLVRLLLLLSMLANYSTRSRRKRIAERGKKCFWRRGFRNTRHQDLQAVAERHPGLLRHREGRRQGRQHPREGRRRRATTKRMTGRSRRRVSGL